MKLGILQFGTVQWIADVIQRHTLDADNGFTLQTSLLASADAGRIALLSGAVDVAVLDWLFVAVQRAAGNALSFAGFSDTVGGLMVPADSPVRSLPDLAGHSLGVAGGPADKSWLLVQAAGRQAGIDLSRATRIAYGAPPLLSAKLQQGELDAVLTYWTFVARLKAVGFREAVSVDDAARALGLPGAPGLVGFVFREDWARSAPAGIGGLLKAVAAATRLLATEPARSDPEWATLRPLMDLPAGAAGDAVFAELRRRFLGGIAPRSLSERRRIAEMAFDLLRKAGGGSVTGDADRLPDGVFWPEMDASG